MNSRKTEFSKRLYLPIVALVALLIVFRFATIVSLAEGNGTGTLEDPFTTEEAVVTAMRNHLKAGKGGFKFWFTQAAYDEALSHPGVSSVTNHLGNACFEHTGVCDEGDYIKENIYSYTRAGGSSNDGEKTTYYVTWYDVVYCSEGYKDVSAESHMNATNKAIDDAMASLNITASMSDYEKARAVYDYVRMNVTYDKDALNDSLSISEKLPAHSSYNAIVLGQAVCQGYSSLLYNMMLRAGVDCRVITGTGNGGAHAWNLVKIDGQYYNVDVTFDSDNGTDSYFLKSNGTFSADHARADKYNTVDFNKAYPMAGQDYARPNEGIDLKGCSVGVGGNILVYYDFFIPKALRNSSTKVVFTFPNDASGLYTQELDYTKAQPRGDIVEVGPGNGNIEKRDGGYYYVEEGQGDYIFNVTQYRFACAVPASRLSDVIQATVYVGTVAKESYPVSVKKFADVIIEDPAGRGASDKQVAFLKAMLNYGSYSQLYFGYNTTKLANAMWGDTVPADVDVSAYGFTKPKTDIGISYYGSSLLFKSNMIERHYFNLGEYTSVEQLKNDYTFTIDNKTVDPVIKEDWCYIQVEGVSAKDLDEAYNITVTKKSDGLEISFNYSALNYVKLVLDKGGNKTTQALMRAIYDYNSKAEVL